MILQVLITMIAGWVNRHQQQVITYLLEENRTLHAKLSVQRIRFTDAERRRLAALAFPLGCKRLKSLATLATPDTLMRWYKQLVAQKFVGESSLRYTLTQYLTHYHSEGNHQGLDNQLIAPEPEVRVSTGQVKRRERLGGLLSYYYRRLRDSTQDAFKQSDMNETESTERFSHTREPMIETEYKHIVLNDNNVAMIAGTRTKVIELVLDYQAYGWSPEELQFQHPIFTMGQIHSALAYYWDHQDELDADIERRWQEVKHLQQSRELSPVEKRLKARKTRE